MWAAEGEFFEDAVFLGCVEVGPDLGAIVEVVVVLFGEGGFLEGVGDAGVVFGHFGSDVVVGLVAEAVADHVALGDGEGSVDGVLASWWEDAGEAEADDGFEGALEAAAGIEPDGDEGGIVGFAAYGFV